MLETSVGSTANLPMKQTHAITKASPPIGTAGLSPGSAFGSHTQTLSHLCTLRLWNRVRITVTSNVTPPTSVTEGDPKLARMSNFCIRLGYITQEYGCCL